eukprot:TRINITY_DN22195_c0_g1_i6.p1 TRINITY_DN22195_c0_g1~~TRINITY_DN22195_c0_g1_i6.p1  ORF type:complete len:248 (+),score=51.97 TRINITY_DN22195_c0_g1_i6:101-745(+)
MAAHLAGLIVSGGEDMLGRHNYSLLNGAWLREGASDDAGVESRCTSFFYRHSQDRQRILKFRSSRQQWRGPVRWCFEVPGMQPSADAGEHPATLPQEVSEWIGAPELRVAAARDEVMRVGGRSVCRGALGFPLSELGVSAECAVEVVSVALTDDMMLAEEGPLTLYVSAPDLGLPDPVAFEVAPDTTVGGLVAAFAERCLRRPESGSDEGEDAV